MEQIKEHPVPEQVEVFTAEGQLPGFDLILVLCDLPADPGEEFVEHLPAAFQGGGTTGKLPINQHPFTAERI